MCTYGKLGEREGRGGEGDISELLTSAAGIKWQLESLCDAVHLVNTQSNRGTLLQHLVAIAIQMPCQHISNLNNILNKGTIRSHDMSYQNYISYVTVRSYD